VAAAIVPSGCSAVTCTGCRVLTPGRAVKTVDEAILSIGTVPNSILLDTHFTSPLVELWNGICWLPFAELNLGITSKCCSGFNMTVAVANSFLSDTLVAVIVTVVPFGLMLEV